ncbi:TPA: hypothetical protein ACH3X1_009019 [Trebouxia sp. C0004]
MRAVTSLLRAASRLPAGLLTAHEQYSFAKLTSAELLRPAHLSSVTATRSHACAWGCMHTFASAPAGLQTGFSSGIACNEHGAQGRRKSSVNLAPFQVQQAGLWTNSQDDDAAQPHGQHRHHFHTQQDQQKQQQQPAASDASMTAAAPEGLASSSPLPSSPQTPTLGSPNNPVNISGVLSPQLAYDKAVETGAAKVAYQPWKTFLLANLAGVYVGFGSFLAFTVGANLQEMAISNPGLQKFLYGAIGLPAGLVMVTTTS